jgi:hypothetical protein
VRRVHSGFRGREHSTWENVVEGHINLIDTIDGSISFISPDGRESRLAEECRARESCSTSAFICFIGPQADRTMERPTSNCQVGGYSKPA